MIRNRIEKRNAAPQNAKSTLQDTGVKMIKELTEKKEKKVEYIELIYDLIFVYIIGRNNTLLHRFSNGFTESGYFLAYIMTTLAVIQIWNYTTYFINIYGRHNAREHVFLFINMFLLYYVGEGTRTDWQGFHTQYHIAWALILINIGIQYVIERRNHGDSPANRKQIAKMAAILFAQAVIVVCDILIYKATGTTWLSLAAIIFGMCAVLLTGQKKSGDFVDFSHLSERVMLYVVFTFGEMIIGIAGYFDGDFSLRNTYFAFMGFLTAVGLFLTYGQFYDHIIDRNKHTNGLTYMLFHIIIIFAVSNITNGLEFMRQSEIAVIPKIMFITASFILFFIFLFALGLKHAKARCAKYNRLCLIAAAISATFAVIMFVLRNNMPVNIAVTVIYIFTVFFMAYRYGRLTDKAEAACLSSAEHRYEGNKND